jgi:hypothetical protein
MSKVREVLKSAQGLGLKENEMRSVHDLGLRISEVIGGGAGHSTFFITPTLKISPDLIF